MAAINADTATMRYFPSPFTAAQTADRIEHYQEALALNGFHFIAAELKSTGTCIGIIGLAKIGDETRDAIPSRPELEIGWRLDKKIWGRGLAPEGAMACLNYAGAVLNAPEVVAITTRTNQPSRRVMDKIGMTYDASDDFEHPLIDKGHPLRPHVLYRIKNPELV